MQDTLRPSQHLSNCPGSNGIPQGGSRYSVANRLALPGCLGLVSPSQPGSRPAAERPASLCLLHSPWEGRHGRHTRPPGVRMQAERREDVLALGRRGFIACDWLPSTVPLVGLASESYSRSGHLASMALIIITGRGHRLDILKHSKSSCPLHLGPGRKREEETAPALKTRCRTSQKPQ